MLLLTVDDDPEDREFLVDAMKTIDPGINCITANDGLQALIYLEEVSTLPDLIFIDLNMPRMGGVELLRILKQKAIFKNVAVVVYSTAIPPELDEVHKLGATFLKKAPTYEGLIAQLKGAIASISP